MHACMLIHFVFMVMCSVHSIFCITQNILDNGNTGYPDQQNHHTHNQNPQGSQSTNQQVSTINLTAAAGVDNVAAFLSECLLEYLVCLVNGSCS